MTDKKNETAPAADKGQAQAPAVRWDDSDLRTSYANVCNVSSTREEVTLLFGTNNNWHTGQKDITVGLSNRIVLNPYAAKRLKILLDDVLGQYEKRFGNLQIEVPQQQRQ